MEWMTSASEGNWLVVDFTLATGSQLWGNRGVCEYGESLLHEHKLFLSCTLGKN